MQGALIKDLTGGQEIFRGAVIAALGDYKAAGAVRPLSQIAEDDGPWKDEAVLALGKIGDKTTISLLTSLQRTAAPERQPAVAAAACLLGSDCEAQRGLLVRTLTSHRPASRNGNAPGGGIGLSALAVNGDLEAGRALFDAGVPAVDQVRAPVSLALARLAVARPLPLVALLEKRQDRDQALQLLRGGFDLLDDDFAEEQFFVALRTAYFAEPEESARRPLIQSVINMLEF